MSVLACITWAREQRVARRLSGPHGDALLTTATFSNAQGESHASAATIGEIIGYCRQETQDLLTDLTRMGLLHPTERRGRKSIRRLRLDAPSPAQLQIDGPAVALAAVSDVGPRRRHRRGVSMSASPASMSAYGPFDVGSRDDTKSEVHEIEEPPNPPVGGRRRERLEHGVALRDWSLRLMPGAGEEELGLVREALATVRWRERMDPTVAAAEPVSRQEVLDYIAARRPGLVAEAVMS